MVARAVECLICLASLAGWAAGSAGSIRHGAASSHVCGNEREPAAAPELQWRGAIDAYCIVCGIARASHVLPLGTAGCACPAFAIAIVAAIPGHVRVCRAAIWEGAKVALAGMQGLALPGQEHASRTLQIFVTGSADAVGIVCTGGGFPGLSVHARRRAVDAKVVCHIVACQPQTSNEFSYARRCRNLPNFLYMPAGHATRMSVRCTQV